MRLPKPSKVVEEFGKLKIKTVFTFRGNWYMKCGIGSSCLGAVNLSDGQVEQFKQNDKVVVERGLRLMRNKT